MKKLLPVDSGRVDIEQLELKGFVSSSIMSAMVETSVSLGLATYPTHVTDGVQLLDKANECLWLSKKTGGNRVMHFEADISPT